MKDSRDLMLPDGWSEFSSEIRRSVKTFTDLTTKEKARKILDDHESKRSLFARKAEPEEDQTT